ASLSPRTAKIRWAIGTNRAASGRSGRITRQRWNIVVQSSRLRVTPAAVERASVGSGFFATAEKRSASPSRGPGTDRGAPPTLRHHVTTRPDPHDAGRDAHVPRRGPRSPGGVDQRRRNAPPGDHVVPPGGRRPPVLDLRQE